MPPKTYLYISHLDRGVYKTCAINAQHSYSSQIKDKPRINDTSFSKTTFLQRFYAKQKRDEIMKTPGMTIDNFLSFPLPFLLILALGSFVSSKFRFEITRVYYVYLTQRRFPDCFDYVS